MNRFSTVFRNPNMLLCSVLLLALGLRFLLWRGPLHQLANDEVEYVTVARDLLAGRGWVFYDSYHWLRAPLYNLFLAGSLWLAGGDLHRAALFNIALSVANVLLSYRLTCLLVGQRAALFAALLTAVLWTNVTFASLYMAETLFTFCFLASLVALFQPQSASRSRYVFPVLAGVFFGFATLTRSASLVFVPVVVAWLCLQPWKPSRELFLVRRVLVAGAFVLAFCLTIAPWSIRNYLVYGRFIPVETGLAYNIWVFNEPRETIEEIHQTLEQIPNPAERSDYATAQGLARVREDPAILVRKIWPNWVYLTRIKPIEDRFILERYYLDVRLPLFATALVLDDVLYVLIALAGMAGLILAPGRMPQEPRPHQRLKSLLAAISTPKAVCAAWLLIMVVTTVLTHGEGRYRHFFFPLLIPFAAWLVASLTTKPSPRSTAPSPYRPTVPSFHRSIAITLLSGVFLAAFIPSFPYLWAAQNLGRGWNQLLGDVALARGDTQAAVWRYQQAAAIAGTSDAYRRLGDTARHAGELGEAEAAYRESARRETLWAAPAASLGDLLRAQNRDAEARAAYSAEYIVESEVVDWSWNHGEPPPRAMLDIGNGLDFGYLDGVYDAEIQQGANARWTNGDAQLRLALGDGPSIVRLRLAAPHPGDTAIPVTVCLGMGCDTFVVARTWRTYTIFFPREAPNMPLSIRSPTFHDGNARTLGVLVDWVDTRVLGTKPTK